MQGTIPPWQVFFKGSAVLLEPDCDALVNGSCDSALKFGYSIALLSYREHSRTARRDSRDCPSGVLFSEGPRTPAKRDGCVLAKIAEDI
jgi:hypothetical protein